MKLKVAIFKCVAITILILSIPFVLTIMSDEVDWSAGDFLIAGLVISGVILSYMLIANRSPRVTYRVAFALGLLGAFLLFWVNGAVGVIGNENQDVNLLYNIIFLIGGFGGIISKFNARGLAVTMFVAAIAQFLIPLIGLIFWPPPVTSWSPGLPGVFCLNSFYVLIFLFSAFLFKKAHQSPSK